MMTRKHKSQGGFTMIEIAFSLAIVAFALVAIMGVLPTGMTVQRDNREDTLINNDAAYWVEALRSGSRGIYDLTNYVEEIQIVNADGTTKVTNSFQAGSQIFSSEQIIGLLTTPKYVVVSDKKTLTNVVTARVRAINGPAIEKGNPKNEFTFRYQLQPEVTQAVPVPPTTTGRFSQEGTLYDQVVATNLHHLRLVLRWPVFEQGNTWGTGRNRRTVRTLINGQIIAPYAADGTNYYFVQPNIYQHVAYQP